MKPKRADEAVFAHLASRNGEDLISIFLPTHRKGRDVAQDRIRLKNQLSAMDDALAVLGWKPRQRSERLANGQGLLDDLEFWEHQREGLAVYIDDSGDIEAVSMTSGAPAWATVMPVFMIRPLCAELGRIEVPVLALTRNEVALFSVSEVEATPLDHDLPTFEEVNWFVDREPQRQQHPDRAGVSRNRHGHDPSSSSGEDLARFLREVDDALERFDLDTPLVVLGDDDLVARFVAMSGRSIETSDNGGIVAPFSPEEVLSRVAPMIARFQLDRLHQIEAAARDQLGVGMGTREIRDALPATLSGRVGQVLIERTARPVWGRVDESDFEVEVHDEQQPGDVDLLDRLVVWSRDNGAEIVASEAPTDDAAFLAVFRY
jgi:hypothetical protein